MAGDIKVIVCQGKSKDSRYEFYPYWKLKIIDEDDGSEATASLTYPQIRNALKKILLHEFRVDRVRKRNPDYVKYRKFFQELKAYEEQLILSAFTVPDVYTEFESIGYEEEITI